MHYAVTAIGADRPGIVAAVTGALVGQGCNLEDSSMTILGGHFAILLLLDAPEASTAASLEQALVPTADEFGLIVSVQQVPAAPAPAPEEAATFTVTVYGADRPGIVHRVSSVLADEGVNIVDLTTRVIGSRESPVYAMLLDVTLPPGTGPEAIAERLRTLHDEIGVDASLHEAEPDIF